jgi:hypothetical protein
MTNIVIKDLNESREMDREAMRAVTGGCANSSYISHSPYSSHLTTRDNLTNSAFSWASGIVEESSSRR